MAKILIAGCGKIGIRLGCKLAQAGHDVWGARRDISQIPHHIKPLAIDFLAPQTFYAIPEAFDYVYIILTPDKFDDNSYKCSYVNTTRNLLAHFEVKNEKPAHIFFTSSTSVYAQINAEWVDENSETAPTGFTGKRILEAEQLIKRSSISGTCVRFAGIYGGERTRLIDRIRNGFSNCGSFVNYRNLIHEDDVIGIFQHLLTVSKKEHVYLGVDHEPVRECDLLNWLSVKLEVSINRSMPAETPYRKRNISNKRCVNKKIIESGYDFLFPTYKEGYRTVMGHYN